MNNNEVFALIKERLDNGNTAALTVTGNSMAPLFSGGKTVVILEKPRFPLRKYDICLYKRANGKVVLHRAVKIGKESACFRGDAERVTERDVPYDAIIACAVSADIDGKTKKLQGTAHKCYGAWRGVLCAFRRFKAHLIRKTK